MFKVMLMLARRKELTHEEFRSYMENHHAPFALKLLNDHTLGLRRYVRNYVSQPDVKPVMILNTDNDYDVINEFWFNSKEAYEQFIRWHGDPVLGAPIRKDQSRFIDYERSRMISPMKWKHWKHLRK